MTTVRSGSREAIWDHAKPQAKPTTTNTLASEVDRLVAHGTVGYMILRVITSYSIHYTKLYDTSTASPGWAR